MNYIIYAKACARTADLVLVIGTSLSGLASDCVPEVGRRHDSECCCCCVIVIVLLLLLLLLLYSAVFCVASSWNTAMCFRILLFLLLHMIVSQWKGHEGVVQKFCCCFL